MGRKNKTSSEAGHKRSSPSETLIREVSRAVFDQLLFPEVKIHVLPGGKMPKRQTEGAIGFDAVGRAIAHSIEMDKTNPKLRQTLFDFTHWPEDRTVACRVREVKGEDDQEELAYEMQPGESVLVGLGFITAMDFPMFYWVAPRSGLAARQGITVTNAPGTVDPDYRGEAGALVYNRNSHPYLLRRNTKIVQVIFGWALIPSIGTVSDYSHLPQSGRGTGGFGSTGLYDNL